MPLNAGWPHSGFGADVGRRIEEREGLLRVARYSTRAPVAESRLRYDAERAEVVRGRAPEWRVGVRGEGGGEGASLGAERGRLRGRGRRMATRTGRRQALEPRREVRIAAGGVPPALMVYAERPDSLWDAA